jgi:hypothetical protein
LRREEERERENEMERETETETERKLGYVHTVNTDAALSFLSDMYVDIQPSTDEDSIEGGVICNYLISKPPVRSGC